MCDFSLDNYVFGSVVRSHQFWCACLDRLFYYRRGTPEFVRANDDSPASRFEASLRNRYFALFESRFSHFGRVYEAKLWAPCENVYSATAEIYMENIHAWRMLMQDDERFEARSSLNVFKSFADLWVRVVKETAFGYVLSAECRVGMVTCSFSLVENLRLATDERSTAKLGCDLAEKLPEIHWGHVKSAVTLLSEVRLLQQLLHHWSDDFLKAVRVLLVGRVAMPHRDFYQFTDVLYNYAAVEEAVRLERLAPNYIQPREELSTETGAALEVSKTLDFSACTGRYQLGSPSGPSTDLDTTDMSLDLRVGLPSRPLSPGGENYPVASSPIPSRTPTSPDPANFCMSSSVSSVSDYSPSDDANLTGWLAGSD